MPIPLWMLIGGLIGVGVVIKKANSFPSLPSNLPDWKPIVQQAFNNGQGYTITQADLDRVEAKLFVHPLDWLVPQVGTIIPTEYLGGENDLIPGSKSFRWKQVGGPKDGPCPPLWRPIAAQSASILEVIQAAAGKPIKVSSWWRGPLSSRSTDQGEFKKRGGWGGYHPCAAAMDIYVDDWVEKIDDKRYGVSGKKRLYDIVEALIKSGKIPDGGLGIYGEKYKIIHYDPRSVLTGQHGGSWRKSRWNRVPDPVTGKVDMKGG